MGANEETHPLYNNPPRVTKRSLSAVSFNMDNQSKKQIRTVPLLRNSSDLLVLVEPTGIEPVSKNPLT